MFNPSLQSLLVHAHLEELQRAAHNYNRARDINLRPAAPLSRLIKQAITRLSAHARAVTDNAAPFSGFELVDSSAPTLRPHWS